MLCILKAFFFSATDYFSVCDNKVICRKGWAYLAFELTQPFSSITDIQVKVWFDANKSLKLQFSFLHINVLVKFIYAR